MRAPLASVLGAHQPGCTLTFSQPCSNQRGRPHSPATKTSPPAAESVRGAPAAAHRSCPRAARDRQPRRSCPRGDHHRLPSVWVPSISTGPISEVAAPCSPKRLGHGQDFSRRGPWRPMALRVFVRFPFHTSARTPQHHRHQAHMHRSCTRDVRRATGTTRKEQRARLHTQTRDEPRTETGHGDAHDRKQGDPRVERHVSRTKRARRNTEQDATRSAPPSISARASQQTATVTMTMTKTLMSTVTLCSGTVQRTDKQHS